MLGFFPLFTPSLVFVALWCVLGMNLASHRVFHLGCTMTFPLQFQHLYPGCLVNPLDLKLLLALEVQSSVRD